MNQKQIQALTPGQARRIDEDWRWRAVWYGSIKHYFVKFSWSALGRHRGETLCGKQLPEYERRDIKNARSQPKCSVCEKRSRLLHQVATGEK